MPDELNIPTIISNGSVLTPIPNISFKNIDMSSIQYNCIPDSVRNFKPPDYTKIIKTPEERNKPFIDRMDNTNEILQEQNQKIDKLQEALNKSQVINEYQAEQLKQLNDKVAESKHLQKIAESNLQEERSESDSLRKSDRRLQIIIAAIGLIGTIGGTFLGWWLSLPK